MRLAWIGTGCLEWQGEVRGSEAMIEKSTQVSDWEYENYCERYGLSPEPQSCSPFEHMAVSVSRECPDGAFIFVGTGLPLLGCMLAQHTHALNSVLVMESGILGAKIEHLPISVSDPRASMGCVIQLGMCDTFALAARGHRIIGVLGAAECDRFGNLNSTAIGGYGPWDTKWRAGDRIRLAGSGGANAIASFADTVIVMMAHEKRRFPECSDYLTSPAGARGRPGSGEHRRSYGLYRGGKVVVITTMGILRGEETGGELCLEAAYCGVCEQEIYENTGWPLQKSAAFKMEDAPSYEELKILRCIVDPTRMYLGRNDRTLRGF